MNSEGIQDIKVGTGPGTRGNECEICMEVIEDGDASISHISCENTFHRACLDDWTKSNYVQVRSTCCPKCRGFLTGPGPTLFGFSFDQIAPFPPPPAPFTGRLLTTLDLEMYDYAMQPTDSITNDVPTPALIHRLQTRRSEFSTWVADYFLRQRRAQNLTNSQTISRILDCYLLFDRSIPRGPGPLADGLGVIHAEVGAGEAATDLEIIDDRGHRRPRPSVVDFFVGQPDEARAWLRRRTTATQVELGLNPDHAHKFWRRFERSVKREIRRRQKESREVQGACSTEESISGSHMESISGE
jgi:Ring finger domain